MQKIYIFSHGVVVKTFEIKKILSQQVACLVRCLLDVEKYGINKSLLFGTVVQRLGRFKKL